MGQIARIVELKKPVRYTGHLQELGSGVGNGVEVPRRLALSQNNTTTVTRDLSKGWLLWDRVDLFQKNIALTVLPRHDLTSLQKAAGSMRWGVGQA